MRITGGQLGGRILQAPRTGLRPTQDKVRAAIFSSLASHIPGARVLDLFAGSGAMGLEAFSRGAQWVEWVEQDRVIFRSLQKNIQLLDVPSAQGRAICSDVFRYLGIPTRGMGFDVVLSDPPYEAAGEENWMEKLAERLSSGGWVVPGGIWVHESDERREPPPLLGWVLARNKIYGGTRVCHWVRQEKNEA